jgi:streptothricin acetyltransferase
MDEATGWARDSRLGTIRLETRSNNVAACLFYQRYGFVIGGHDRLLYHEPGPGKSEEVALFWYLTGYGFLTRNRRSAFRDR